MPKLRVEMICEDGEMHGRLVIDTARETTIFKLSAADMHSLAESLMEVARAVKWHAATLVILSGPPHHIVRRGEGRTFCGHEVDERRGWAPDQIDQVPNLCRRCEQRWKAGRE